MIKGHLAHRRNQIYEEIRNYPPPIPACDQQYNHLLEQRTRISHELTRLDQAIGKSLADKDPAGRIEQFIQSSSYVDTDTAQQIRALLKNPHSAPRIPDDGEEIGRLDAALERDA